MQNLKSIFSRCLIAAVAVTCLTVNAQAKTPGAVALQGASKMENKKSDIVKDSVETRKLSDGTVVPIKPTGISPLLIGETVPVINIPDAAGKLFNLNDAASKKPTILVFYRGGWCPFCNKELAGLQAIQGDLAKMGYQLIAISTDSPDNLAKSIGKHQLSYTLLSDADLSVSKQFGIAYKAPAAYSNTLIAGSNGKNVDKLLPVPSVFILDQKGIIQFEYINPDFKQRIGSDLLQSVAGALVKENAMKADGK